jgi:short-subunit dehydrogenase
MNTQDVILITGASKGLGAALARELGRCGHPLVLNARGARELQAVADEVSHFTRVVIVAGDVSEIAEELAERALSAFGRVDVLINNASDIGITPLPPLERYAWQSLLRLFTVNAVAPMHLIQLLLPGMRTRGRGTIVNISSDAAVNAYPGWGGYGASKAALEQLSRVLAKELEGSGVRVLVVDPGDMNTEMHRLAVDGDLSHLPDASDVAPRIVAQVFEEAVR